MGLKSSVHTMREDAEAGQQDFAARMEADLRELGFTSSMNVATNGILIIKTAILRTADSIVNRTNEHEIEQGN